MTPCPMHPFTPRTDLGCVQCHGEELAGKDRTGSKSFIPTKRGRGRPRKQNFDIVPDEADGQDPEVQEEVARTIKQWKRGATNEWGRWSNA